VIDDDEPPLAEANLTKEDVQRRVDDWLKRLSSLFDETRKWAQEHGWSTSDAGKVPMVEELMRKYDVPQAEQPTLKLTDSKGAFALFKPKGLWIIGANGRIDLYTTKGAYIIVDLSEPFGAANWTIFRADNKREGKPYIPALLAELV
jgi:hypothetical protein